MGMFRPGLFTFRKRGGLPAESHGVGAVLAQAVEDVAARLAAEWRAAEEAEREAEEQARLDVAADFIRTRVRKWGSWFPTDD